MRGPALLLLALLALPAAQACSPLPPPTEDFDRMAIDGDDGVIAFVDGSYQRFNVTDGSRMPAGAPPGPSSTPAEASAPDGSLRIEMRTAQSGTLPCSGLPASRPVGFDLVAASGPRWQWGRDAPPWNGTAWGNATHGYVWDHDARQLSIVHWTDGTIETHPVDLGEGARIVPPYPASPASVWRNQLVLSSRDGTTLLDPAGPSVRLVASPFAADPNATAQQDGDFAFMRVWNGSAAKLAAVELATGREAWRVDGIGGHYSRWTPHALVLVESAHEVRLFRDGVELDPVRGSAADTVSVQSTQALIAVAIRGPAGSRLLVYDASLHVLLDWDPDGRGEPETSTSTSSSSASVEEAPTESTAPPRGSPGLAAPLLTLALAAALVAARRRLRP